jgi:hypothetical protein
MFRPKENSGFLKTMKRLLLKNLFYRRASFSTEVLPSAEETAVKTAHGEKVPLFYALHQTADDPMFFGIFKKPNSRDRSSF